MSFEVTSLELMPLEMATVQVVSLEATVSDGSTAVTPPETVTLSTYRLARRGERQRHGGERRERELFPICKSLHCRFSLFIPSSEMATAARRFTRSAATSRDTKLVAGSRFL